MAYVYILESLRDGRYYIGSTKDIEKRLKHHKSGFTHSTKRFGGIPLEYFGFKLIRVDVLLPEITF